MIHYNSEVTRMLYKEFHEARLYDMVFDDWLRIECKKLGIRRIYDYDSHYVFECNEDELVFRLRFSI
jgi:hypothetical protein